MKGTAIRCDRWFTLLLAVLACASTANGQGAILYVQPPTPLGYGPVHPSTIYRELDLNGDGVVDFAIDSLLLQTTVLTANGANRMLAFPNWDGGTLLDPLQAGLAISQSPPLPDGYWANRASISACSTIGCLGPWLGLTAYAGVEFGIGAETHYGWIRIFNFADFNAGNVLDWAYETRPNTPLLTGAVPEPSTWALLGTGTGLFWWYGRRKQKG